MPERYRFVLPYVFYIFGTWLNMLSLFHVPKWSISFEMTSVCKKTNLLIKKYFVHISNLVHSITLETNNSSLSLVSVGFQFERWAWAWGWCLRVFFCVCVNLGLLRRCQVFKVCFTNGLVRMDHMCSSLLSSLSSTWSLLVVPYRFGKLLKLASIFVFLYFSSLNLSVFPLWVLFLFL